MNKFDRSADSRGLRRLLSVSFLSSALPPAAGEGRYEPSSPPFPTHYVDGLDGRSVLLLLPLVRFREVGVRAFFMLLDRRFRGGGPFLEIWEILWRFSALLRFATRWL